jgi:hypothetical protein
MTEYCITREEFYDELGESIKILFFIKQRRNFMGITWWSYVRYKHVGPRTIGKMPIHFNSAMLAEDFINRILKRNKKYNRCHRMIIKNL